MKNRVVITGMGAICSLGNNTNDIWNSILNKKIGYQYWKHPDDNVKSKFFGRIDSALNTQSFSKKILKNLPRFGVLGLIAANEAVMMAFNDSSKTALEKHYHPKDCGVIFGTGWGGIDDTIENNNQYENTGFASTLSNLYAMPSICTASIAINWNCRGYQNTPSAACATGTISIGDAYELIKNGKAKVMIAGGSESIRGNYGIWTVDILGALSKEQKDIFKACCPYDKNRSGFVLSEGAAALVLEDYSTAIKRGANILAEITGYSNTTDAVDVTAPSPDLLGRIWALEDAIKESNLSINQVDYINVHGTSTQLNDQNETLALKEYFKELIYDIPVSSTKSYTGHLIAATGALETIFCVKSIIDEVLPATINLRNPDPNCDLNYIPNNHLNKKIENAVNINYGFGGSNSCLVIKRLNNNDNKI